MNMHDIITVGIVITVVSFLLFVIFVVLRGYIVSGRLEKLANNIADFLEFNQKRLEKIRPYIVSYFNSLHKEENNATEIMNQIMYALEQRISNADLALNKGSYNLQKEALNALTSPIVVDLNKKFNVYGDTDEKSHENEYVIKFNELEDVVENLFQSIGQDIAAASKNISMYRGEKNRRKDTIFTLMEAGIKNIDGIINKDNK